MLELWEGKVRKKLLILLIIFCLGMDALCVTQYISDIKFKDQPYRRIKYIGFKFDIDEVTQNLWYNFLDEDGKDEMVKRLSVLPRIKVKLSTGEKVPLFNFIMETLKQYSEEIGVSPQEISQNVVIKIFGSYLYSPQPKDIDLFISIKNSSIVTHFLPKYGYTLEFPSDAPITVNRLGGSFRGENSPLRYDILLRKSLTRVGITLFGNRSFDSIQDKELFFNAEDLLDKAYLEKKYDKFDTAINRLMEANLLLQELDPTLNTIEKTSFLYEKLSQYIEEKITGSQIEKIIYDEIDNMAQILGIKRGKLSIYKHYYLKEIETLIDWGERQITDNQTVEAISSIMYANLLLDKLNKEIGAKDSAFSLFKLRYDYLLKGSPITLEQASRALLDVKEKLHGLKL